MRVPLVIGVDAGATSTRCVLSTVEGAVVGRGGAGGANQNSSGGSPAEALTAALRAALGRVDPGRVALGVVGAAGAAAAGRAEALQAAEEAWRAAGLSGGGVRSVTDLEVAFAAGTALRAGLLLLSGTGAAAVAFQDGVPHKRCDGYGWLLGDEGSAVWLGREALRAVLCGLDGRGPATLLTGPVTAALDAVAHPDPDEHAQALVRVAYRRPPASLGLLAPLVNTAAGAGDEAALRIVEMAAAHLLHSLSAVSRRVELPDRPAIVLGGSVLLHAGPVADRVRGGIRERFRVAPSEARDGAAGAAVLAIAGLTGGPVDDAVHARLTAGA